MYASNFQSFVGASRAVLTAIKQLKDRDTHADSYRDGERQSGWGISRHFFKDKTEIKSKQFLLKIWLILYHPWVVFSGDDKQDIPTYQGDRD